jgi:hypothetical protein
MMSIRPPEPESLGPAPEQRGRRRPKAPHRLITREVRQVIIANGEPMTAVEIMPRLSRELQNAIGGPERLPRILRRSKRGGLIRDGKRWAVRKRWLNKSFIPQASRESESNLARTRRLLTLACDRAVAALKASSDAVPIRRLYEQVADIEIDERLFRRALWNRAKSNPSIRHERPAAYRWMAQCVPDTK